MSGHEDAEHSRRNFHSPYTKQHPVPTISRYREEKEARQAAASSNEPAGQGEALGPSKTERAKESWRDYWQGSKQDGGKEENDGTKQQDSGARKDEDPGDHGDGEGEDAAVDTSEAMPVVSPKERRKDLKKGKENRAEREVTDPITHLPVKIHDFTNDALEEVEENPAPFGTTSRTATGISNKRKSRAQLDGEKKELQGGLESMNSLFPPPSYDELKFELTEINKLGMTVGLIGTATIILLAVALEHVFTPDRIAHYTNSDAEKRWWLYKAVSWLILGLLSSAAIWELVAGVRTWMANRIEEVWETNVWEANLEAKEREAKSHETETVSWLNSLFSSVWPLINPDLFTSLADTLEDVMQASLPKVVQMVSVEDVGQGTEALRILGIRWLPTGAAARSVGADGNLQSEKESGKDGNDRSVPGEGEVDDSTKDNDDKQKNQDAGQNGNQDYDDQDKGDGAETTEVAEGMEAEEGDFINLEVGFAYRARSGKAFKDRTKDMHMYLAFYLIGNIKIPVWVDVKGVVGTCRMRLQLTPDPPFFALCTITFLGQPKVNISCVPIFKKALNIMDLPLISNFVQGSVDAALASYVAPKSITLDLKDMLAGDDFKKDTNARGVLVVDIIRGYEFKMGDASIPLISSGGSDPYVSVGWAKFGKPMFSTRVLIKEMEPYWQERCYLPVTPEELNVDERIRIQLWDSDRFSADDDLGRIELDLKSVMRSEDTNGKMCSRTDGFRALKAGEAMPGKLDWKIGYFSKTRLQKCQYEKQNYDTAVRSEQQMEEKVESICQRKLREARIKKGRHSRTDDELEQQKKQEKKVMEDALVISAPPPDDYPSGIFSIVVHQITGLELETQGKDEVEKNEHHEDEEEQGESLPSAYCTVIINHKKIFKTRTKPKNAKPFYNAGTERFIGDWQNAEVYVAVRDARVDEMNPLIGIVHLPLGEVFKDRAQVNGFYPLTGGVGYGRVRISMVWRSVQLQAPKELIGWDYGTIEINTENLSCSDPPSDLQDQKVKWHTTIGSGKMYPNKEKGTWTPKKGGSLYLPVSKRYASCVSMRIKHNNFMGKEKTAAFAVLWLKNLPDDEERQVELPIYKGDYERATSCCLDDPGEKVGSIKVRLTFWAGLGAGHRRWASKDVDLQQVMEVLDTARDNYESKKNAEEAGVMVEGGSDDTSDSSSDSDSDTDDVPVKGPGNAGGQAHGAGEEQGANGVNEDGKMNLVDQAKEYSKQSKQKHRQQRGLMQYKAPRNAQWAGHQASKLGDKISSVFGRHTREPGVETEV